jgi:hypothetical protein
VNRLESVVNVHQRLNGLCKLFISFQKAQLKKEKKIQNYIMLKKHLIESKAKAIALCDDESERNTMKSSGKRSKLQSNAIMSQ